MEDRLKQFIDKNKAEFDNEQLPEGHFERFEAKLPATRNNRARIYTLVSFAAAACIALLLIYKLPFMENVHNGKSNYVCEMGQEVNEVKLFYHMQMNDIVTQMEEMYAENQTPGAAELLKATKKVQLDSQKFEKDILPTLPCSDDGIFALNQHYSNSLESMQYMKGFMEQLTTDTHNN